jgi:carbamoyltransferase
MVGKLKKWFPKIKNIFCDPVPYDGGLSLGAARYLWHHVLDNPRVKNQNKNMTPYLGKIYTKKVVEEALSLFRNQIKFVKTTDRDVLDKVYDQKIVAVFGGGSESGRRALGNRSILADPRNAGMKDYINSNVKHREWFRPLAPSILEEKVGEWFKDPILSPYMSLAAKFKEEMKNKVPAVVHFDGTARLQTVNKNLSPWFHRLLTKWEALSGVPILVNTSFNDNEPIVETPHDAVRCFLNTKIDYLYFFDYGIMVAKS